MDYSGKDGHEDVVLLGDDILLVINFISVCRFRLLLHFATKSTIFRSGGSLEVALSCDDDLSQGKRSSLKFMSGSKLKIVQKSSIKAQ